MCWLVAHGLNSPVPDIESARALLDLLGRGIFGLAGSGLALHVAWEDALALLLPLHGLGPALLAGLLTSGASGMDSSMINAISFVWCGLLNQRAFRGELPWGVAGGGRDAGRPYRAPASVAKAQAAVCGRHAQGRRRDEHVVCQEAGQGLLWGEAEGWLVYCIVYHCSYPGLLLAALVSQWVALRLAYPPDGELRPGSLRHRGPG